MVLSEGNEILWGRNKCNRFIRQTSLKAPSAKQQSRLQRPRSAKAWKFSCLRHATLPQYQSPQKDKMREAEFDKARSIVWMNYLDTSGSPINTLKTRKRRFLQVKKHSESPATRLFCKGSCPS